MITSFKEAKGLYKILNRIFYMYIINFICPFFFWCTGQRRSPPAPAKKYIVTIKLSLIHHEVIYMKSDICKKWQALWLGNYAILTNLLTNYINH
jgi:hypothetical protein